jgi:DNA-directed RNA polymerase subunit M/transcription elongation factor TFIIS
MGNLNSQGRCPKCGGNLYLDKDYNGWYEQCLQCGYMKDLAVVYQHRAKVPLVIKTQKKTKDKDIAPDK